MIFEEFPSFESLYAYNNCTWCEIMDHCPEHDAEEHARQVSAERDAEAARDAALTSEDLSDGQDY